MRRLKVCLAATVFAAAALSAVAPVAANPNEVLRVLNGNGANNTWVCPAPTATVKIEVQNLKAVDVTVRSSAANGNNANVSWTPPAVFTLAAGQTTELSLSITRGAAEPSGLVKIAFVADGYAADLGDEWQIHVGCAATADTTAPTITITTPANGATYTLGQPVAAGYTCTDAVDPTPSCAGTVAAGADIDTGSVGETTFAVNAADASGNASSLSHTYNVVYGVCGGGTAHAVMSPFKGGSISAKRGRDVPVKIQLCDHAGNYVTNAVATISGPSVVSENTHPASVMRASDDKLIFNLSTNALPIAAHPFTITLDDGATIPFTVNVTK